MHSLFSVIQQRVVVNELNQIGPPFCQVYHVLDHCYSGCTLMIL